MFVAWGAELGFLYNDAYAEILGVKHPDAIGRRFYEIWSEIVTHRLRGETAREGIRRLRLTFSSCRTVFAFTE